MSAGLGLGLVGAAIGGFFGGSMGASLGWSIGAGIGGWLDAPDTQGPRLVDRGVEQMSSYGTPIPIIYGAYPVIGRVIWPANFTVDEHEHTEEVSAKGGGGPEHTTYSYTATFAVLLCRGPLEGIGRIWMNEKLVYDPTGGTTTDPCISTMRIYLGTEDQSPDPLMVARDGSAPAYRGWAYIVFEDLELTDSGFGNRPPVVKVECFSSATTSGPSDPRYSYDGNAAPFNGPVAGLAVVDPQTGYIWTTAPKLTFGNSVETYVTDDLNQTLLTNITTAAGSIVVNDITYVSQGREIWVMGWQFIAQDYAWIYNADTLTLTAAVDLGYRGSGRLEKACYNPTLNKVLTIGYGGGCRVIDPLTRTVESSFGIGLSGTVYIAGITVTEEHIAVWSYGSYSKLTILNQSDWSVHLSISNPYAGLSYSGFAYDSDREKLIHMATGGSMAYNIIDIATGSITSRTLIPAADADALAVTNSLSSVVYVPYNDRYVFGANAAVGKSTTLHVVNPDTGVTENTWAYEAYVVSEPTLMMPPLIIPKDDPAYILSLDLNSIKRMKLGGTIVGGPVTLASIVHDVCTMEPPDGLSSDDINVTELTDLVPGYIIDRPMTRRAAIEPHMPVYFFDGVEGDHILKFPKRGQSPVVTIPQNDRAAHEYGSDMPQHLNKTRGSELLLPWRMHVVHTDPARDYQAGAPYDQRTTRNANDPHVLSLLAISMAAATAKSAATVNLYLAWTIRTKFSWTTSIAYAKYEPSDVVTQVTDDVTYIVRITSKNDQGNGIIAWEGELEDIAIYDQDGIVPDSEFVPQSIYDPGETVLHLIDSPIMRDDDNDASFYVAMGGTLDGWRGASLFKSSDGGSSWGLPMLSVTEEAAIGVATTALPNFAPTNIFDEGNTVTITLQYGSALTSATVVQVLNGTNTCILGTHGRWEVLQFKTATLIAANTYRLSGLLRGRYGTEWARGTHQVGDTFILASVATWRRPVFSSSEIGLVRHYKAPPLRTRLANADAQAFTNSAVGLKPYSPVNFSSSRDGSNNVTLRWYRRGRYGHGPLHAAVPLGEASELYEVDVYSNSSYTTVVRTIEVSTTTATYTAAQQVTDGLTPGNPVYVKVYQISAIVDRGYALEAIAA